MGPKHFHSILAATAIAIAAWPRTASPQQILAEFKVNEASVVPAPGEYPKGSGNAVPCTSYDQKSGVPTAGKVVFEPVVIRKNIDSTSPALIRALAGGLRVDALIRVIRQDRVTGKEVTAYSVSVGNGRIVSIRQLVQEAVPPAGFHPAEEIVISFQSIHWQDGLSKQVADGKN